MNTFILLDKIAGLVSMGLRFTEIMNIVNQRRQEGAGEDTIDAMLDDMADQAEQSAIASIQKKRSLIAKAIGNKPVEGEMVE